MYLNVYSSALNNRQIMERAQMSIRDEWTKKMGFMYSMEYYLAMRKHEILPLAATWVELEGVMLGEISQAEKDRYHMFSLICGS